MANLTISGKEAFRVDVKQYGAVGNGTVDDTAAFQAAIDDVEADGNGKAIIYVPAGVYKLTAQLSASNSIAIRGDGMEQSILSWGSDSTTQGLAISYTSTRDKAHPYVGYLSFVRSNDWGGTAISIDGSGSGSHADSQRATIENVRIDRGNVTVTTGSWEYGIHATSVTGCYINNVSYQGDNDENTPSTDYYGTFIRVTGTDADSEVNAHFNVTNTICSRAQYAVHASNCEGIYITNCRYFNNDYGIKYDNTGATTGTTVSPRIMISGGHIKSRYRSVEFVYTTHGMIRDIYFLDATTAGVTEHVLLSNTLSTSIEDCHFEGLSGSTADGIKLTNSTFDCMIQGNNFAGTGSSAIELDSTSNANFIGHNFFRFDNWTNYVNNSAGHVMRVGGKYTLKLDSTQAITTGAGTLIAWDSVYKNELGSSFSDLGTNANRITIARRGKYRVTAYLQWAANTTGYRYLDIRVNGSNAIGSNGLTVTPASSGNTRMTVVSDIMELNTNDYITAYVEQNSGGNLNIQINATLTLEYVGSH